MKDMDRLGKRDNFNYQWQKAFEDEYLNPPNTIWESIDAALASDQIILLTRQKKVYKWVATISLIFSGALIIYMLLNSKSDQILSEYAGIETSQFSMPLLGNKYLDFCFDSKVSGLLLDDKENKNGSSLNKKSLILSNQNKNLNLAEAKRISGDVVWPEIKKSMFIAENEPSRKPIVNKNKNTHPFQNFSTVKQEKRNTKLWASVTAGGGNYDMKYRETRQNPVISGIAENGPSNFVNTSNSRVDGLAQATSIAVETGFQNNINLSFGLALNEKLMMMAGLQYTKAQVEAISQVVLDTKFYDSDIAVTGETLWTAPVSNLLKTNDITEYSFKENRLVNEFEFASIPLKVGYLMEFGRFDFLLNTGILTQLYLGNQLSDTSRELDAVNFSPGKESPYRQLNFAGQGGIVLGYEIIRDFALTVEPSYSLAFHSQSKSESTFSSNPSTFNLSAGIRYSFN